nr:peptidoglycan recognition family protein [Murinocardiopsis flavida]
MSRRNALRGAAFVAGGVLLGGAADLGGPTSAMAATLSGTVYKRGDWKARKPKQAAQVLGKGPDHIIIHHTATANSGDRSKNHAFALSRSIQRYHMDSNKWDDTGQQLTISRGGHVMEGRNGSLAAIRGGRHVVGAHVANHNAHTIGIESEGTYTSAGPPTALLSALVETCAWLCAAYGLNPAKAIVGHRDYNKTSCPGDKLYSLLPKLRSDVGARMARLEVRLEQLGYDEVPKEHLPTYPEVPMDERTTDYYHGPAFGDADPSL